METQPYTRQKQGSEKKGGVRRSLFSFLFRLPRVVLIAGAVLMFAVVLFVTFQTFRTVATEQSTLSFLPADTKYLLRITTDQSNQQVRLAAELLGRFPGADAMHPLVRDFFSKGRAALAPIFSLADKELFLANISPRTLELGFDQLVFVAEVPDKARISSAYGELTKNPNVELESSQFNRQTLYRIIPSEANDIRPQRLLHPVLSQLAAPFSQGLSFATIGNFLVSADKEGDLKRIVSLLEDQRFLVWRDVHKGTIAENRNYKTLQGRLPPESLVSYYRARSPSLGETPFVWELLTGFAPRESAKAAALTAENDGFELRIVQEAPPGGSGILFSPDDSLARSAPQTIQGQNITMWFETQNIDLKHVLGMGKNDVLDALKGRQALYLASRERGAPPIRVFTLQTNDIRLVQDALKNISIDAVVPLPDQDLARQEDVRKIHRSLEAYYDAFEAYPLTLQRLVATGMLSAQDTFDLKTGQPYAYTFDGRQYRAEATLSDGTVISVYGSSKEIGSNIPAPERVTLTPALEETYNGAALYSLPSAESENKAAVFWIVGADRIIFSEDLEALKEMYDFALEGDVNGSLANTEAFKVQNQKGAADSMVLGYINPEGLWGLAEHARENLANELGQELSLLVQSYLKTIDYVSLRATLRQGIAESSAFFRISELPQPEKEEADSLTERVINALEPDPVGRLWEKLESLPNVFDSSLLWKPLFSPLLQNSLDQSL